MFAGIVSYLLQDFGDRKFPQHEIAVGREHIVSGTVACGESEAERLEEEHRCFVQTVYVS
jgi:hypothetical protein